MQSASLRHYDRGLGLLDLHFALILLQSLQDLSYLLLKLLVLRVVVGNLLLYLQLVRVQLVLQVAKLELDLFSNIIFNIDVLVLLALINTWFYEVERFERIFLIV